MKRYLHLLTFFLTGISFFYSNEALPQNQWDWSHQGCGGNHRTEILTTDKFNNVYLAIYYHDSLYFNGQAYYNALYFQNAYNALLVKVNGKGEIAGQLNFTTLTYGTLYPMKMVADSSGNLFIAGAFTERIFVGDTIINHLPVPWYYYEEAYLLKLDNSLDIKWAKVIGASGPIDFKSLLLNNGNLVYITDKRYTSNEDEFLYCFGQDTIQCNQSLVEEYLFTLDANGNLLGYNVFQGEGFWFTNTFQSSSGDIYLSGLAYYPVYYNNSLILSVPQWAYDTCYLVRLDSDLSFLDYKLVATNSNYYFNFFAVNDSGDAFFTVKSNSDISVNDSIIPVQYTNTYVIGKLSQDMNLQWWESYAGVVSDADLPLILRVKEDTLYSAFTCISNFYLKDTMLIFQNPWQQYKVIRYGENGEREYFLNSSTSGITSISGLDFDNCGNIILAGLFQGKAYFGTDTLAASSASQKPDNVFIAYLNHSHSDFDLGADVSACGSCKLEGPLGWDHYKWEPGGWNQRIIDITATGLYTLTTWNEECCYLEDSVYVTILDIPDIDLGNDTLLKKSHSLQITASAGNVQYLWSTGDTTASITLPGNSLEVGMNQVWCRVYNGSCMNSDTLNIEVIDDYGIEEKPETTIRVFPNPFSRECELISEIPVQGIEVFDVIGREISCKYAFSPDYLNLHLYFMDDSDGWMIIKIRRKDSIFFRKILRLPSCS
jgi:hypothetical protein